MAGEGAVPSPALCLFGCRRSHWPGEKDLNFSDATHRFVYLLMDIESKVEFLLLL